MLIRFVSLVLVLGLLSASAHASTQTGLKAAFDELNYALTVDWDQKDRDFYDRKVDEFKATLTQLQAEGLTNAELVAFVKTEVKDKKVARDLETAFTMISLNQLSPAEASNYMMDTMRRSYNQGASWNGSGAAVGVFVAVLLIAAAVATGLIVWNGPTCGHSSARCGTTCHGFDCDAKYCCWD